jgi:hypothetical protein
MEGPPQRQGLGEVSCTRSAGNVHVRAGIGASILGEDAGVNYKAVPWLRESA